MWARHLGLVVLLGREPPLFVRFRIGMHLSYSKFVRRIWVLIAVLAVLPATGAAYMKGYLPLKDSEIANRFPQQVIRAKFVQGMNAARVGFATVRFLEETNEIQFSGVDGARKPWTVTADAMRGGGLYSGGSRQKRNR